MYLQLFFAFFKTGLFAIGGGLATLPFLYEISEAYGWFSTDELANMLAISESTPGPIGVNMATYAGFTTAGVIGALVATLGLILPALLITAGVAAAISRFRENRFVGAAFSGIRPAVVALISVAFLEVLKVSVLRFPGNPAVFLSPLDVPSLCLLVGLYALAHIRKNIHPILLIVLGAVFGIFFRL